jgi:hypothetical protein
MKVNFECDGHKYSFWILFSDQWVWIEVQTENGTSLIRVIENNKILWYDTERLITENVRNICDRLWENRAFL